MAKCTSNTDCLKGLSCDPKAHACSPVPLAPDAPACDQAKALPRKTFGEVIQLSSSAGANDYHLEPGAALTGDGSLVVVYIGRDVSLSMTGAPQPNALGLAVVRPDGTTITDKTLPTRRLNQFDPWLGSDRQGTVYATWLGFDGPARPERNMHIGVNKTVDGVNWTPASDANHPEDCPGNRPGCFDKPMLAVGPDRAHKGSETLYVSYFASPAGGTMMVKSTDGGKSFGKSIKISLAAYGDLEVDDAGIVHHVYAMASPMGPLTAPGSYVGYVASLDGGKTITPESRVSAPDQQVPFFFSNPQIASDVKNKLLYVVYPAGSADGAWDIFLATSRDKGISFTRIKVNDDATCANHMTPTLTLDPETRDVLVVWTENRGSTGGVAFSRCRSGGASCSANEAVSDRPFAAYKLIRHSPVWMGEYFDLIADAKRNTLHVVWTQPVAEGKLLRSRIFYTRGKLKEM